MIFPVVFCGCRTALLVLDALFGKKIIIYHQQCMLYKDQYPGNIICSLYMTVNRSVSQLGVYFCLKKRLL